MVYVFHYFMAKAPPACVSPPSSQSLHNTVVVRNINRSISLQKHNNINMVTNIYMTQF